jgi:hypothetical protein
MASGAKNSAQEPLDSTPLADAAVTEKPLGQYSRRINRCGNTSGGKMPTGGCFLQIGAFS